MLQPKKLRQNADGPSANLRYQGPRTASGPVHICSHNCHLKRNDRKRGYIMRLNTYYTLKEKWARTRAIVY